MIEETVIIHAGDLIRWRERSGFVGVVSPALPGGSFTLALNDPPAGLRVLHKGSGTVLWHPESAGPSLVVKGDPTEDDLRPPPKPPLAVTGIVSDRSGQFLPRAFSLTLGGARTHEVGLYRTPLGARFGNGGGIRGRLVFDGGPVACWAVLTVTVTPTASPTLAFIAQADQFGEFLLPLNRLPALTKDAPATSYPAHLSVTASRAAVPDAPLDPDTLQPVQVASGKDGSGHSFFAGTLDFSITPGTVAPLKSPDHDSIVLG